MDTEKFGKYLRKLRIDKGFTQKDFGNKLGVSIQAVSKWELGHCMPDIATLHEISKLLNININDLLEGNETKEKSKKTKKTKLWLILVLVFLLCLLIVGIGFYKYEHSNFEVKIISTTCEDFNVSGFAAYDHKKTSIFITDVDYCGEENLETYEEISCNLYEEYNKTSTLISTCDLRGKNTTLEDYLKDVEINVTNYSAACKKFVSSSLVLHITAIDKSGKTILYEIPMAFEDDC